MSRVLRVERDDALKKAERTAAGFLKVEGRIARTGIQIYTDSDGKERRELRPAEEVFSPEALASFVQVPVTNLHPPGLVTPQSAKHFAVGAVGENVRRDETTDYVAAPFVIYDADAIASVEAGRTQLSCGYSCELDETPGVWQGERYDAVQRLIRGNHLAVVDAARGGPALTMRLDAAGNSVLPSPGGVTTQEDHRMPQQIRVDGLTLDITEGNALAIQQAVDKVLSSEKARADAAESARESARGIIIDLQSKLDAIAQERADADAKKKAAKASEGGKCDECDGTGKVDGKKCENCDGSGVDSDSDDDDEDNADSKSKRDQKRKDSIGRRISRAVTSRVALELEARKHLGEDAKLDGLGDLEVKQQVLSKLAPTLKLDGKDAGYIGARFDAECDIVRARPSAVDQARAGVSPLSAAASRVDQAAPVDPNAARQRMLQRNANAWKPVAKTAQ